MDTELKAAIERVQYANGGDGGDVRACPTEEEFFHLCGVQYLEPQRRPG